MKKKAKNIKTVKKLIKPLTIGRTELLDFPDLGLEQIPVKVDTGAFTSSFHCKDIKLVKKDGKELVQFMTDIGVEDNVVHTLPLIRKQVVKSSFGDTEERYTVRTKVHMIKKNLYIEFSLTDRSDMKYPILLGRKFLQKGFIVDVNKKNRIEKKKKTELSNTKVSSKRKKK